MNEIKEIINEVVEAENLGSVKDKDPESMRRMIQAREIVKEISDFGVSQDQIFQIIHLLALELENREAMVELSSLAKEYRERHQNLMSLSSR